MLHQKITTGIGLLLSLGLVSCEEKSAITPDKPTAAPAVGLTDIIPAGLSKKYTLTKHGLANLTYYADGRLRKVQYGQDVRGSLAVRTEYIYGAGTITATSSNGNGEYYGTETYVLNAITGRCSESKVLTYLYSNSTLANVEERVYHYNEKGQLTICAHKDSPAERIEYTYTADGDLSKATRYGAPQFAYPVVVLDVATFAYDQPTGDPVLVDRYPLNAEWTGLPDEYLPIFGKPGKHLVKLVTHSASPDGDYYTYTLNADGYVTGRKKYNLLGGALADTQSYTYLVTALGFSL